MQTNISSTSMSILVTGGTGVVGRRVVKSLEHREPNIMIKVGGRDQSKCNQLGFGKNSNFTKFDFLDSTTWDKSLEGVERVFLIALPTDPSPEKSLGPFIEKCKERKLKKIVVLSVIDAERVPMVKVEQIVQKSGISFVILRPPFFSENLSEGFMKHDIEQGVIRVPIGDHSVNWISTHDIGECASIVLMDDKFNGRTIEITGNKPINFRELSEIVSKNVGKQIRFEDVKPHEYKKCLMDRGLSESSANYLNELFTAAREDKLSKCTKGVNEITGHDPRSFDQFAKDTFSNTSGGCTSKPVM
ncbi:hypothetical protein RB653_000327 [Dictyostelium firmibasis]|uniref:NmrA-like domain-containing protein n=1 Tax=Dictyostelium firmibasis TaxID=79012 RepID=A0AAN7YVU2_9MYCE